jgi:hypothetical protein
VRVVAGPAHFDPHDTVGLRAAARKVPVNVDRGGANTSGRESLRALLASSKRGIPAVAIHPDARWTVNAFAGGFCRAVTKAGVITDFPVDGPYRTLAESLESLVALTSLGFSADDNGRNYGYSSSGHRYLTSLPQPNSQGLQATKR